MYGMILTKMNIGMAPIRWADVTEEEHKKMQNQKKHDRPRHNQNIPTNTSNTTSHICHIISNQRRRKDCDTWEIHPIA
jgi:hypothetical protein